MPSAMATRNHAEILNMPGSRVRFAKGKHRTRDQERVLVNKSIVACNVRVMVCRGFFPSERSCACNYLCLFEFSIKGGLKKDEVQDYGELCSGPSPP